MNIPVKCNIDNNSIDWRTRSIFEKSLRPFLSGSVHIDKWENVLPYNSNHYRYRGSNFLKNIMVLKRIKVIDIIINLKTYFSSSFI